MRACLVVAISALGAVLTSVGCHGPSCEQACEKVFTTCQLSFLNPDDDIQTSQSNCAHACDADMNSDANQALAVGWVACVDEFQCDPGDEGIALCVTCQAGYYVGQSGRAVVACQVEGEVL